LPTLSGCGKKPLHVDPPANAGPDAAAFPRGYPNPKHDGAPPPAKLTPQVPTKVYPGMAQPGGLGNGSTVPLPGQDAGNAGAGIGGGVSGGGSSTGVGGEYGGADATWPGMPRP
jgi:hypothetical protein